MEKQQILSLIQDQLTKGVISNADLIQIANNIPPSPSSAPKNLINVFYWIGAIISILGVSVLVIQHWNDIGFGGRLLATLGLSVATYVSGLVFRAPSQRVVSQIMYIISACLSTMATYVLLHEGGVDFSSSVQCVSALSIAFIYGIAFAISKKQILILIVTAFATWAYYAFIFKIFGSIYYDADFITWATMLHGVSYLCIAYGYRSIVSVADQYDSFQQKSIQNVLYGLGAFAILAAGIFVGGSFDLFYIALIFAAFYGSVYVRSGSMLFLAGFFLMAHIIKLTSKYFVDSIGWPVALIITGFLVIAIGYGTFYVNKKFISQK